VIRYIKMDFVSIRGFVFTLIYIAILFVKINARENIISSGVELSTYRMEGPATYASIVRAPIRRNQPCPVGEKRGPSGKCRKRWWGEITVRFFMCLNVLNKAAYLCLLSKWNECWMGGSWEFFFCQIFLSSKLLNSILICDIWVVAEYTVKNTIKM
jgi:hypothetical protein